MKNPKVEIESMGLSENYYKDGSKIWNVPTLLQYVKEMKYETFKMPVAGVDLSYMPWDIHSMKSLLFHLKRIKECDLSHPILLDDKGMVCDGTHRIIKAILDNKTEIDAIRIQRMPPPDAIEDEKE